MTDYLIIISREKTFGNSQISVFQVINFFEKIAKNTREVTLIVVGVIPHKHQE